MFKALRFHLNQLAWLGLVTLVLGQFGRFHWVLELFSHFAPLQAGLMLVGAFANPRNASSLLFVLAGAGVIGWGLTPWPHDAPGSTGQERRVMAYNLRLDNPRADAEAAGLNALPADALFLTEATPAWGERLAPLKAWEACARYQDGPFGLALFTRQPVRRCQVLEPRGLAAYPYIRAELDDGTVLYGIHPPPPLGPELAAARDESLRQLAEQIALEGREVVVMGDFNSTAFSPRLQDFLADAGLRLTAQRVRPTWWPGLLGVDLILLRSDRTVKAVGALPWQGSDHRAVWLDY